MIRPVLHRQLSVICVLNALALAAAGKPAAADRPLQTPPPPYLEYQVYEGLIREDTLPPVLASGRADYRAVYQKYDLCRLAGEGLIDEVWFWGGNGDGVTKGHLWESTISGPGWGSPDAPDCGRVISTMAFNYTLGTDQAVHAMGHRMETFFKTYFLCDFVTQTWPWEGDKYFPQRCVGLFSDQYGFVARPFTGNNHVGGCGDIHHPPNIPSENDREYIYADFTPTTSNCEDWSQDGSAQLNQFGCERWGCTALGFYQWWMQNVPGLDNTNRSRSGLHHPNWLAYLFGPPASVMSSTPTFRLQIPRRDAAGPSRRLYGIAPARLGSRELATAPGRQGPIGALRGTTRAFTRTGSATTKKTVFVINFAGYGTPLKGVGRQNEDVISALRDATVYHGYLYYPLPAAHFVGQDGAAYAGAMCNPGTIGDNLHIRLSGLRTDHRPVRFVLLDPAGGGRWEHPCTATWMLYVQSDGPGRADLYAKPYRSAPDGTVYTVQVYYDDESVYTMVARGREVIKDFVPTPSPPTMTPAPTLPPTRTPSPASTTTHPPTRAATSTATAAPTGTAFPALQPICLPLLMTQ